MSLEKRDVLQSYLRDQLELAKRSRQNTCIVRLGVDDFQAIVDQHGYASGVQIIENLAHFLSGCLRAYDKVFRYEESGFVICLPTSNLDEGYPMMERVRIGVASLPTQIDTQAPMQLTISCSMALLDPSVTLHENLERLNQTLQEVQSTGKNTTLVWRPRIL